MSGSNSFDIWYATDRKFAASFKTPPYSDTGVLKQGSSGLLEFVGSKSTLKMQDVTAIQMTAPPFPFIQFAIVNTLLIGFSALTIWPSGDAFRTAVSLAFIVLSNVFLLILFRKKWIEIRYKIGAQPRNAYFFDASSLGWGGMLGGNKKIFQSLNSVISASRDSNDGH